MFRSRSPLLYFFISMLILGLLAALGPKERSLGANVRLVYLHGAWVWTSLLCFALSAALGLWGLLPNRTDAQRWSIAFGQSATFFWITYLPISLLAMRFNWNGLFLSEPRWRLGMDFAIISLLLQAAILVMGMNRLAGALNFLFFAMLGGSLVRVEQIMHPPSPITSSGSFSIQLSFTLLLLVCLFASWQLSRWLQQLTLA